MSQVLSEYGKLIGTSANNIQVAVMPQASTVDVGTVVQYIGTTNANYTNGYFYKCVSDGAVSPTYSWEQVDVQPASDAAATFVITISGDGDTTPYTADKTPAEVEAAYAAGKVLVVRSSTGYTNDTNFPLLSRMEDSGLIGFIFSISITTPTGNDDMLSLDRKDFLLAYSSGGSSWTIIRGAHYESEVLKQVRPYMPTADSDHEGDIVQYIGGTTSSYTNGYFYMCVSDGSGGYTWTQLNVQPANNTSATFDITLSGDGDITPYSVDKTPDEVVAAMTAGQVVRVIASEGPLSYIGPAGANAYSFGTTFVASNHIAQTAMVALAGTGSSWTTIIKRTYSTDSVTGKADKVSGATNGNFAALDANGNITDSGHKHSDYLTSHQDISGKADKPATATTGNFASFDANKNPVDSGKKASDFLSGTVGVANGGTGQTTLTANAVLTGNGTTAIKQVATASGALYATAANGAPTFGTLPAAQGGTGNTSLQATRNAMGLGNTTGALPVANGGTGATTFTSGAALVGAGTGAVTTRAITNNTAKTTAPAGSTNLATMNSLLYGMQNYSNRASAVNAADTNYTTAMARAIYATTTDLTAGTTALTNGTIALVYE